MNSWYSSVSLNADQADHPVLSQHTINATVFYCLSFLKDDFLQAELQVSDSSEFAFPTFAKVELTPGLWHHHLGCCHEPSHTHAPCQDIPKIDPSLWYLILPSLPFIISLPCYSLFPSLPSPLLYLLFFLGYFVYFLGIWVACNVLTTLFLILQMYLWSCFSLPHLSLSPGWALLSVVGLHCWATYSQLWLSLVPILLLT